MAHFVYVVQCADGTLYTGYTTDVAKRIVEHNGAGETKTARTAGARYTRGRRPVTLVYTETLPTRGAALSREHALKQLSRQEKLSLIEEAGSL